MMQISASLLYQWAASQRYIAYLLVLLTSLVLVNVAAGGRSQKQIATFAPVVVQPVLPEQAMPTLPSTLLASGPQHRVTRLRSYNDQADIELAGTLTALSLWLQVALLTQWRVESALLQRVDTNQFHLALNLQYSPYHAEEVGIASAVERLTHLGLSTPTELPATESKTTASFNERCDSPPALKLSAYLTWIGTEVEQFDLPSAVATLKGEYFYRVHTPVFGPTSVLVSTSLNPVNNKVHGKHRTLFIRESDDCQYEIAFPSALQQAQLSWLDDNGLKPHWLP